MRHLATFTLGAIAGALLALLLTQPTQSRQASAPRPAQIIPPARWGSGEADPARTEVPTLRPSATPTTSSGAASATAALHPVPSRAPKPTKRPVRPAHGLSGVATWFRAPKGTAAAGPALRASLGKSWRGSVVRVCSGGRCVRVRLTDWCACGPRHGQPTLVDLGADSFARLAPLSAGVVDVVIR